LTEILKVFTLESPKSPWKVLQTIQPILNLSDSEPTYTVTEEDIQSMVPN